MTQAYTRLSANAWTPGLSRTWIIAIASTAGLIVIGLVLGLGFGIGLKNKSRNLTLIEATTTTTMINTNTTSTTSTSAITTTVNINGTTSNTTIASGGRPVRCSAADDDDDDDIKEVIKNKITARLASNSLTPLLYHGGPVMTTSVIYLIWYGNWTGNNGTTIVENFLQGLGSTAWWNITIQYNYTSPITYGRSTTDSYSQGRSLNTNKIFTVVRNAIHNGTLPKDTNGIYFVLTSADCNEDGFCTGMCGWHSFDPHSRLIFGWVGNAEQRCPTKCAVHPVSPNGNPGVDAMLSIIAHELSEAVTDPHFNAWYGKDCADENADRCSFTYGLTNTLSNGAKYNMVVNGYPYLIQQNWRLSTQSCGLS